MDSVSTELSDDDKASKIAQMQSEKLNTGSLMSCHNCKCINTSLWRKDSGGNNLCNACGLFLNKNGYHRSIKQQSDDIFIGIDQRLMKFNKVKRRRRILDQIQELREEYHRRWHQYGRFYYAECYEV
jgi:hypothetical protein